MRLAEKYYLESLLKLSRQLKKEGMTADKTCMVCQYGKDGDRMQQRKSYPMQQVQASQMVWIRLL
ncbi:MAG: hypothetical protein WBY71_09095 [Nitrososphaeraceae archaeon]